MMTFFLFLAVMLAAGAVSSLAAGRQRLSDWIGAGGITVGSLGALVATVRLAACASTVEKVWPLPLGTVVVGVDALSAVFLCIIFVLAILAAWYGFGYGLPHGGHPGEALRWFWMSALVASMALVVVARDAVLFILAWEIMSLASFFLVASENNDDKVRQAAWTYLIATHLGTACILAMFLILGNAAGALTYHAFAQWQERTPGLMNLLFLLALVGFGTKAGFYPLHVWLPEAHPAAPSHVSALMSGVMIKTAIYAFLRFLFMLGTPPVWWGGVLVAVGIFSGIAGVVQALAQCDLKRLLAYSSVENIGIIVLGCGLGLLGWSCGQKLVMVAGFAGSLLHVINHAAFKGLLFLAAGAVARATNCRNMEILGGLLKKMPVTGAAFLVGAWAITGLPPLNGFISEFLIYLAALGAVLQHQGVLMFAGIAAGGALALIGGLAVICFTKAFGMVFLGEPRTPAAAEAQECGWQMRFAMLALVLACFAIVAAAPVLVPWLASAVLPAQPDMLQEYAGKVKFLRTLALSVALVSACAWLFFLALVLTRRCLFNRRNVAVDVTWDCGFAQPSPRMQYTAASFTQPATGLFQLLAGMKTHGRPPTGFFPARSAFTVYLYDAAQQYFFRPIFTKSAAVLARLLRLQEGRVQIYVFYLAITLFLLLLLAL